MECICDDSPFGEFVDLLVTYYSKHEVYKLENFKQSKISRKACFFMEIKKIPCIIGKKDNKDSLITDEHEILMYIRQACGIKEEFKAIETKLLELIKQNKYRFKKEQALQEIETNLSSIEQLIDDNTSFPDVLLFIATYPQLVNMNTVATDKLPRLMSLTAHFTTGKLAPGAQHIKDFFRKKTAKETAASPVALRPVDDISRLEIRVGKIRNVWVHPDAEKLFCEEIDIGEPEPRMIASGLRAHFKKEDMMDRKVLILANMKPKNLRGFASHGMVLCASSSDGSKIEFVQPPANSPVGERVLVEGHPGDHDAIMNTKNGKDPFIAVKDDLRTDEKFMALYKDSKFMTSEGACFCTSIGGGTIS